MLIEFTEVQDPRVADYFALTDSALRQNLEVERGLFMAESLNVVERAIAGGCVPRSFLVARNWLEKLAPVVAKAPGCAGQADGGPVPVFVADDDLLSKLTGFHIHRGVLAAMQRPFVPSLTQLLQDNPELYRLGIIDALVDHTNVGAAFRSAAAIGVDALAVSANCADPLYRRAVRVSMGTVFQIPWTRITDWSTALTEIHAHGFTVAALALRDDSMSLEDFSASPLCAPDRKLALVLGSEGYGLPAATIDSCDVCIKIPMRPGVDSLNVAAAAALAFWETRRRFN